jgi:DNA-binding CsgD family transcriptional regulator
LVGTEQPLLPSLQCIFLRAAEALEDMDCNYCRFTYAPGSVSLAAILTAPQIAVTQMSDRLESELGQVRTAAVCFGGSLQTQLNPNHPTMQILLTLPYANQPIGASIYIACGRSLLQTAFSQLAQTARLIVTSAWDGQSPIITEDPAQIRSGRRIIWIDQTGQPLPPGIHARINLSIDATQLRQAVEAVITGNYWGLTPTDAPKLSERELATLKLLGEGLRDRDIAQRLMISESTVKFHMNNVMAKLKAKTRYQALYLAVANGWIG